MGHYLGAVYMGFVAWLFDWFVLAIRRRRDGQK
jgi:hypothetical protein